MSVLDTHRNRRLFCHLFFCKKTINHYYLFYNFTFRPGGPFLPKQIQHNLFESELKPTQWWHYIQLDWRYCSLHSNSLLWTGVLEPNAVLWTHVLFALVGLGICSWHLVDRASVSVSHSQAPVLGMWSGHTHTDAIEMWQEALLACSS